MKVLDVEPSVIPDKSRHREMFVKNNSEHVTGEKPEFVEFKSGDSSTLHSIT